MFVNTFLMFFVKFFIFYLKTVQTVPEYII